MSDFILFLIFFNFYRYEKVVDDIADGFSPIYLWWLMTMVQITIRETLQSLV